MININISVSRDVGELPKGDQATKPDGACLIGCLLLEVKDNGVGIAAENIPRVFEQFSQFDKNKLQGGGGSGLGLWISQRIMLLHGGSILFTSEGLGKGTSFYLHLPVYQPLLHKQVRERQQFFILRNRNKSRSLRSWNEVSPDDAIDECSHKEFSELDRIEYGAAAASLTIPTSSIGVASGAVVDVDVDGDGEEDMLQQHMSTPTPSSPGAFKPITSTDVVTHAAMRILSILVADDSHVNRKVNVRLVLMQKELESAIVTEADDGDIALELVKASLEGLSRPFDVVLLDSVMLRMHGPQAVRCMRDAGYHGTVIGVTGNALPDDIANFIDHGADDVLVKPLKVEMLVTILKKRGII
jgi:CheY-like chemotaxis protein